MAVIFFCCGVGDDGGMVSNVASRRLVSVDVLRGLTIALMILVNDPGDWGHVFGQLDHAPWNGWTLTDTVFPTFLFLVGASIVFSMASREAKGDCRKTQAGHIFLRALKLEALAWVLAFFPRMHWTMRVYGVLPRIALCYLVGALLVLALSLLPERRRGWALAGIVAAILLGYWVLLRWVPVPGLGVPGRDVPFMDQTKNLAAWMDRGVSAWMLKWLHTGKLYQGTRDPEGLLSTLPAVATVLLGALVGMFLRGRKLMRGGMLVLGGLMFGAGTIWGLWFPVNKNLWTSSYVLVMAGIATMALALLNWLLDGREEPWPKWLAVTTWPWRVFGSNAIAAFTVSVVIVKTMIYFKIADSDGDKHTLWALTYQNVFARHGSTEWTSLAFAVTYVVVCFLPVWVLWRRKIFWRM